MTVVTARHWLIFQFVLIQLYFHRKHQYRRVHVPALEVQAGSGQFSFEVISAVPIGSIDETGVYISSEPGTELFRVGNAGRT